MGVEIERKFLVTGQDWKSVEPEHLCQGYLNTDKYRTVRVRTAGKAAFLTIKGKTENLSRPEFEYQIPRDDALSMLKICVGNPIEKNRYSVKVGSLIWEVDEFLGANKGLIVAEVELETESQEITLPSWVGLEVSGKSEYYNSSLASAPFSTWSDR